MTFDRRDFLKLAVTGGAVGMFTPGGGLLSPNRGHALELGAGPKRLLTIYMPGGWQPSMMFTPFTDPGRVAVHWPSYLASPGQITNLDGTGDEPNPEDGRFAKVRTAEVWDEALMGTPASFAGSPFWPDVNIQRQYGYSWRHFGLADHTCVLHGVDQQTAEHYSGRRASLSGVAGARFTAPAMHCIAAHAMALAGSHRPLGAVTIKTGGAGGATPPISRVDLPAHASPTTIAGLGTLAQTFSDQTAAWDGLRHRDALDVPAYDGSEGHNVPLTRMDQYALRRFRQFRGLSDESFYERLYDAHVGISRKMALDLVTILQATPGFESESPHWVSGNNPYQLQVGRVYGDNGDTWREQFDLVLKLFKADVCTAINVQAPAAYGEGFDIHSSGESSMTDLFNRTRGACEVIGRLLGEMKNTPGDTAGTSLLDDTLVVLISDFARAWPALNSGNGHWPFTSYVFIGGGIHGNRMLGDYDLAPSQPNNPTGVPVDVDGGAEGVIQKPPAARDVVRTVYRIMGIPDEVSEISGGPNEVLGVRAV